MAWSMRQAVELFHLQFLRQLCVGTDRDHFALKGGCNLRFFFGSLRYSEDLDLDVRVTAKDTLKNKIDRLLASPALALPLKASGIAIVDPSAPKQTETTQRWKLGLTLAGQSAPVRTKIEFSRRDRTGGDEVSFDALPAEVSRLYGIPATVLGHYRAPIALKQKIEALIGRAETQARDVFDLQLLRSKLPAALPPIGAALHARIPEAIERTMSLSYDDYVAQVVAYLDPTQQDALRDREIWNALQAEVVGILEELRP